MRRTAHVCVYRGIKTSYRQEARRLHESNFDNFERRGLRRVEPDTATTFDKCSRVYENGDAKMCFVAFPNHE